MPLPKDQAYTIDDIYNLPEGTRAELIGGKMYMIAPPSRIHQEILIQLSTTINSHIKESGSLCRVYPAPFAVFLNDESTVYVEPDISVICNLEHDSTPMLYTFSDRIKANIFGSLTIDFFKQVKKSH